MFRKLRIKLMLVNLSVIALLFFLLIIGTYFFVQGRMIEGSEHMMARLSHDLVIGKPITFPPDHEPNMPPPPDPPPEHGPGPGPILFFIKTSITGDILHTSSFIPLTKDQLWQLTRQIQHSGNTKGNILFNQTEYFYQITPTTDNQENFIVFQDFQRDRNLLKALVTGLSITGIICMILSVFGSLFMANKAMIPIQKAWQQQKGFLADASHEFRTPLAVIQTNLEIVRDNPTETVNSQEQWLNNIYEETICMTKLVESLLFLARADSRQQLLIKEPFLLQQAVSKAVELLRLVGNTKGVTLIMKSKQEILYYGDESKLRQVVSILLDNALRHTQTGGRIIVTLEKLQQNILLSVTDTGEGIAPEHMDKIFERFYQSDLSRSQGGTGLGLSIAKWIVESHNGRISVVSSIGKGSIFSVFLPHE